jgi:hypothetical protein
LDLHEKAGFDDLSLFGRDAIGAGALEADPCGRRFGGNHLTIPS